MSTPDRRSWEAVSPYLDEALELFDEDRDRWLAGFERTQPELAADVRSWLADLRRAHDDSFLEDAEDIVPARAELAGTPIGAYRLVKPIGAGGMGSVWLAERSDGRFEGRGAVN